MQVGVRRAAAVIDQVVAPLVLKFKLAFGASNLSGRPSSNLCLSCGNDTVNQDRLIELCGTQTSTVSYNPLN